MALLFILYSLFLLSSLLLFRHFYHNTPGPNPKASYSGPKAYPILGNLIEFVLNRHRFLEWMTEMLSRSPTQTVTLRRLGGVRGIVTANPLNVEYMLKNNFENYPKGPKFISLLHDFIGDGIFNSDGDMWKIQRKMASFEFSTKSLRSFVLSMVQSEINQRLIPLLEFASSNHKLIDLQDVLERFAFDNVCKVAFGEDPACLECFPMSSGQNLENSSQESSVFGKNSTITGKTTGQSSVNSVKKSGFSGESYGTSIDTSENSGHLSEVSGEILVDFDEFEDVSREKEVLTLPKNAFLAAFEEATVLCAARFLSVVPQFWKVLKFFHVASEKKISDCIRVVHGFANGIIRARRAGMESNGQDLMSSSSSDQRLGEHIKEMNGQDRLSCSAANQRLASCDEPRKEKNGHDRHLRSAEDQRLGLPDEQTEEVNGHDPLLCSADNQRSRSSDEPMLKSDGQDLLSRFMADQRVGSSDEILRDVVVSFILAGRDTTSSALTWFFWLLTWYPEAEQNIRAEIQNIREKYGCGQNFGYEELKDMHYLHASVTESMRLYPPVPLDSKECLKDDVLPDGNFVEKGWYVAYSAYAMGRMEVIWGRDFTKFRPERWLRNGVFTPENNFKYPVFHAGPRLCLGKEMAYVQMKSIAACIVERYEVTIHKREKEPLYTLSLTLRMKGGLPISLRKRKTKTI
ncbi:hypothetical protein AMTRI_Chr01g103410 [Amborella trichopoda]